MATWTSFSAGNLRVEHDGIAGVLLHERQQSGIEKADLKQDQERHGSVDLIGKRVEHRGGEVQPELQLDERLQGYRLPVFLADPFVGVAFDTVFRRSGEIGLFVEERLEYRASVVDA